MPPTTAGPQQPPPPGGSEQPLPSTASEQAIPIGLVAGSSSSAVPACWRWDAPNGADRRGRDSGVQSRNALGDDVAFDELVETTVVVSSMETYLRMVQRNGSTVEAYRTWFRRMLREVVFAPSSNGQ